MRRSRLSAWDVRCIAADVWLISGLGFLAWKQWRKAATFNTLHLRLISSGRQRMFLCGTQQWRVVLFINHRRIPLHHSLPLHSRSARLPCYHRGRDQTRSHCNQRWLAHNLMYHALIRIGCYDAEKFCRVHCSRGGLSIWFDHLCKCLNHKVRIMSSTQYLHEFLRRPLTDILCVCLCFCSSGCVSFRHRKLSKYRFLAFEFRGFCVHGNKDGERWAGLRGYWEHIYIYGRSKQTCEGAAKKSRKSGEEMRKNNEKTRRKQQMSKKEVMREQEGAVEEARSSNEKA